MCFAQEPGFTGVRLDQDALVVKLRRQRIIELVVRIDPFAVIARRIVRKKQAHQRRSTRKTVRDIARIEYPAEIFWRKRQI